MLPQYCEFASPPTAEDNNLHTPTTDDKWWQESALFCWGDPRRGFGGWIRIGMQANQGTANLYAWVLWKGQYIFRKQLSDLKPPGELLNDAIACVSIRTIKPLEEYEVRLAEGALDLKFRWRNYHWPIAMGLNVGAATVAAGHYNMMGEISGELAIGDERFAVTGAGFTDHSWGVRRRHLPASRSYFAVFDPNFYVMAMPVLGETGERRMLGYVHHQGQTGRLGLDSRLGYAIEDDWVTVGGCNSYLFDEFERGFHVTGRTIVEATTWPMGHGKLVHHAVAQFECGGQIGRGILETSHPKRMRPDQIAQLGLDPDSWWLNEAHD